MVMKCTGESTGIFCRTLGPELRPCLSRRFSSLASLKFTSSTEDNCISFSDLGRIKILKIKHLACMLTLGRRAQGIGIGCAAFFWEYEMGTQNDNKPIKLLPT